MSAQRKHVIVNKGNKRILKKVFIWIEKRIYIIKTPRDKNKNNSMKKSKEPQLIRIGNVYYIYKYDIINHFKIDRKTLTKYLDAFEITYIVVGKRKVYDFDKCKQLINYLKERKESKK